MVASSAPATLSINLLSNGGLYDNSYSVNLSTGMKYKISQIPVEGPINGNVFSLRLSNNSVSAPFAVHGIGMRRVKVGFMQP